MNSADFQKQTNWIVITGAPSSGKTSVIDELMRCGYHAQPEAARMWIENALQSGLSLQQINNDIAAKQRGIIQTGLALHAAIPIDQLTFMDRGIPDSIAYLRLARLDTAEAQKSAMIYHYRAVFIFDRLPVVRDDVRSESDEVAAKLDVLLEEDYRLLGYSPVRVPVMPVAERANFMLKTLGIVP